MTLAPLTRTGVRCRFDDSEFEKRVAPARLAFEDKAAALPGEGLPKAQPRPTPCTHFDCCSGDPLVPLGTSLLPRQEGDRVRANYGGLGQFISGKV